MSSTMPTANAPYPSDLPVMLSIAGHDPTGGAGIQADLETAAALGVHGASLISCLTVQDSHNVQALEPIATSLLQRQLECLLADIRPQAVKLGLLGSSDTMKLIAGYAKEGHLPNLVLDPVLAAGGGKSLSDGDYLQTLTSELLPQCLLITPNLPEALALSGKKDPAEAAAWLCDRGCAWVFISGGHSPDKGGQLINSLYNAQGQQQSWRWPRLPGDYHGSGCTLASAIAALLAKGLALELALQEAQAFVWRSLAQARHIGSGQLFPGRTGLSP